jgi:pyruvate dehydrogenase E2 component (dihydrolipoamide acetyltransferase)
MPHEFKLPDLGEGIHEGEIIDVVVSVGDTVEDGQTILVVETDKAAVEVPSPVTGVVKEIKVKPGDMVNVGAVLMTFEVKEKARGKDVQEEKPKEKKGEAKEAEEKAPEEGKRPAAAPAKETAPVPAAPSTRRLARELGVDLRQVPPSGPGGRVTSEDVRAYAEKGKAVGEGREKPPEKVPVKPAVEALPAAAVEVPSLPDFTQWGAVERVPLRSVRRATAKRMALAWSQIPHVTHTDVADITDLEAFRQRHKAEIEAKGGKLSITVFALKAAAAALKEYPYFNASLDMAAGEIVLKHYHHIGVAVDTDRGLIVPVIRDVDCKSIGDLSKELPDLAGRTRDGKADVKDMAGGTFTITNIGALGGTGFTPIINYPQVAILGMGQARLKPVVRGDINDFEIVPRLVVPLALGFDHRVADGADAARFLNFIIDVFEDPEKLMVL